MRFAVCMLGPASWPNEHGWFDLCRYLCYGLEDLGHDCTIVQDQLPAGRIPIVIGTHAHRDPAIVRRLHGARPYVLLHGDYVGRSSLGTALHTAPNITPERVRLFHDIHLPIMRAAAAVWTGHQDCVDTLADVGIRAGLLRGGYLEAMREIRPKRDPDIDFLFYGSLTPHRERQFARIEAKGGRIVNGRACHAIYRNDLIARAKVILAPHQGPDADHFGWAKICYCLNQGCLVAVEQARGQEPYQHCFPWAPSDTWPDICLELLHVPDRAALAAEHLEAFRHIPFTDPLAALVAHLKAQLGQETR